MATLDNLMDELAMPTQTFGIEEKPDTSHYTAETQATTEAPMIFWKKEFVEWTGGGVEPPRRPSKFGLHGRKLMLRDLWPTPAERKRISPQEWRTFRDTDCCSVASWFQQRVGRRFFACGICQDCQGDHVFLRHPTFAREVDEEGVLHLYLHADRQKPRSRRFDVPYTLPPLEPGKCQDLCIHRSKERKESESWEVQPEWFMELCRDSKTRQVDWHRAFHLERLYWEGRGCFVFRQQTSSSHC